MAIPVPTKTKVWTLEELHSLPDDGNKYELMHGELFVTPPPTVSHEDSVPRRSVWRETIDIGRRAATTSPVLTIR
jgi:hypothetical protein